MRSVNLTLVLRYSIYVNNECIATAPKIGETLFNFYTTLTL